MAVFIFLMVLSTWPFVAARIACGFVWFLIRGVGVGVGGMLANRSTRLVLFTTTVLGILNVTVQFLIYRPQWWVILTTIEGWVFAFGAMAIGYGLGAAVLTESSRVVGGFKVTHVSDDGTETPCTGRMILDHELPPD